MENFFGQNNQMEQDEWIAFSDLMAVMMVIFLFISIIYWDRVPKNTKQIIQQKAQVQQQLEEVTKRTDTLEIKRRKLEDDLAESQRLKEQIDQQAYELKEEVKIANKLKETAVNSNKEFNELILNFRIVEKDIYEALLEEFRNNLPVWNAELIRENLIFRFKAPEVLFPTGQSELTPKFEKILTDFIPRYVQILKKFEVYIEEIRVEGHTSSEFSNKPTDLEKYIANLNLSQDRTREVTEFALLSIDAGDRPWLQNLLTANGLSSSKLIKKEGVEDRKNSRRVEFTVRTAIRKTLIALEELSQ